VAVANKVFLLRLLSIFFCHSAESISTAPEELTSADRQRIQEWVQKQLPNSSANCPTSVKKSGSLEAKHRRLSRRHRISPSLICADLSIFPAQGKSGDREALARISPAAQFSLKDEVAAVLSQINNYVIAYFRGQLLSV